jgi:hypothetical protein
MISHDLKEQEIGNAASAGRDFHEPGLLVGLPSRGLMPYIVIPEGFYALVTTNGAEQVGPGGSKVWPSGYHTCAPWTKISHLITKTNVMYDTPCKGCKTKDNVSVQIDVCVTFRIMGDADLGEDPNLVPKFVHEVTPRGLQQQLRDAIDEAVRVLARSMKHHEVYGLRSITIMTDGTVVHPHDDDPNGFERAMQGAAAGKLRLKIDGRRAFFRHCQTLTFLSSLLHINLATHTQWFRLPPYKQSRPSNLPAARLATRPCTPLTTRRILRAITLADPSSKRCWRARTTPPTWMPRAAPWSRASGPRAKS